MNKFWGVTGGLLLLAVAFIFFGGASGGINFDDLETECRYERTSEYDISLQNNRLSFSGHYSVNSTNADVSYKYSQSGDRIVLDIVADNSGEAPESYWNQCLASVIYSGQTSKIDDGSYDVILKHDGETVEHQVISIK